MDTGKSGELMIFRRKKRDAQDEAAKDATAVAEDQADLVDDEDVDDVLAKNTSGDDTRDGKGKKADTKDAAVEAGEPAADDHERDSVDGEADDEDALADELSRESSLIDSEDADSADADADDIDPWSVLDEGDYRDEGPFDIDEVDLDGDEITRIDLGTMIITPFPGAELRLNVVEGTRQVVSVMIGSGNSALDLTPVAAPASGGVWADERAQLISDTEEAGGSVELVEGPFGTEVRRTVPVKGADGQDAYQPTRTWMAQGPRWALRGVLYGEAALSEALTEDPVLPLFDAFRDVIVRRGDRPQRSGEVLLMTVPEGVVPDPALEEPTDDSPAKDK